MIKIYSVGFLILFNLSCWAQTEKVIDWAKDIKYLKKELPSKHYNLFFSMSKKEYISRLDSISSHLSELNDFEIAVKLTQVVAKIGDSHTTVGFRRFVDKDQALPLKLYWFSDGLYVLGTTKENKRFLGTKVVQINSFNLAEVADSLSTLFTQDNQAMVKDKVPELIPLIQLLKFFKFAKSDTISLKVIFPNGKAARYHLCARKMTESNTVNVESDSVPLCRQSMDTLFYDKYIENEQVYYLQYNKCWSKEQGEKTGKNIKDQPSFVDFENKVFSTLMNKHKPIRKFIFDMRFNEGGSSTQGTEFITKLAGFTSVNQQNKLYVVVGRKTFSSAIINAVDFKQNTKAILVGEETSGKPNHYGDVRNFRLPSSQLFVNYSTKYFKLARYDIRTIKPEVKIEQSFLDYKKGIDPVYDWIVKQN